MAINADAMEDVQTGDPSPRIDAISIEQTVLQLSEVEQQALDLYDRLLSLQLETQVLEAQQNLLEDINNQTEVTDAEIEAAERELVEAKALYALRGNTVESVLIANPILKAVHGGANYTSALERDLLPLLTHRDSLSLQLSRASSRLSTTLSALQSAQAAHLRASAGNAARAAELLALAAQRQDSATATTMLSGGGDASAETGRRIAEAQAAARRSRRRWRVLREAVSGVVAGSGVDWARDAELRGLVMLGEDEDE